MGYLSWDFGDGRFGHFGRNRTDSEEGPDPDDINIEALRAAVVSMEPGPLKEEGLVALDTIDKLAGKPKAERRKEQWMREWSVAVGRLVTIAREQEANEV
jgi:hypothetical protein